MDVKEATHIKIVKPSDSDLSLSYFIDISTTYVYIAYGKHT